MFEIICTELTAERKRLIAEQEVIVINKVVRGIMAVGGAWIFIYATGFDIPAAVKHIAVVFAAVGIVILMLAIFAQRLTEASYFSKAAKKGFFPASVLVGEGGVFVRRAPAKKDAETPGVTSVNAETFFAYAEVGPVEENKHYFKLNLNRAGAQGVFLFKKDFGKGDPEAFKAYISKQHQRSK